MTALDLLIVLERFRTLVVAIPAYQPHANILKPVLDEFDAACAHLKSRYQEEATRINQTSPGLPALRNTIYTQGYDAEGKALSVGHRGSTQPDRDIGIMNAAVELYYAAIVRRQSNITPEVLWQHIMGEEWQPVALYMDRVPTIAKQGETLGAPYPDWPEWCRAFRERLAYQHGVADERHRPKDSAGAPTIHYDVVFEFANKHNLQYNDIAAMISRAMEPRPASKELL